MAKWKHSYIYPTASLWLLTSCEYPAPQWVLSVEAIEQVASCSFNIHYSLHFATCGNSFWPHVKERWRRFSCFVFIISRIHFYINLISWNAYFFIPLLWAGTLSVIIRSGFFIIKLFYNLKVYLRFYENIHANVCIQYGQYHHRLRPTLFEILSYCFTVHVYSLKALAATKSQRTQRSACIADFIGRLHCT